MIISGKQRFGKEYMNKSARPGSGSRGYFLAGYSAFADTREA
jgi:hypothetical protein